MSGPAPNSRKLRPRRVGMMYGTDVDLLHNVDRSVPDTSVAQEEPPAPADNRLPAFEPIVATQDPAEEARLRRVERMAAGRQINWRLRGSRVVHEFRECVGPQAKQILAERTFDRVTCNRCIARRRTMAMHVHPLKT